MTFLNEIFVYFLHFAALFNDIVFPFDSAIKIEQVKLCISVKCHLL